MATLSSRLTPLTVSVPRKTDWISFTPTINNIPVSSATGRYCEDGSDYIIDVSFTASGAATGLISFTLPNGVTIDTADLSSTVNKPLGQSSANDGTTVYNGSAFYANTTSIYGTRGEGASLVWNATTPFTWANTHQGRWTNVRVPITGLSSHTASATSANAVVVGGQSVGSTMNFGATSNQGFNILANNVAAIASTAGGALTLGLPSAIGGSTYAGQAIVGRTNGSAISAGYVGERISATGGGIVTGSMPAANIVANVNSMSLTPGIWHVFGSVAFSSGATTVFGADNYVGASISTTSATENAANANFIFFSSTGAGVTRNSSTFDTLNLSATTTVYLTTRHGATTIGGASYLAIGTTGARFYAIRIA